MNELKIDISKIGKGADNYEIVENCSLPFNKCISRLLMICWDKIKQFKNDPSIDEYIRRPETIASFERLKNISTIARTEMPNYIISRSFCNVIKVGKYINNHDADYFLSRDYDGDKIIKNDENKTMIHDVIRIICKCYYKLSQNEKDEVWELAAIMLIASVEFHKHLQQSGLYYGQDKKYHYVPEYDHLRH